MTKGDHLIWTNYGLDYEDYRDQLDEDYPELSDAEKEQLMYELNDDYLQDERANLNIQLSQPILVVAQLGLWNGVKPGYREIESGNIRDCLYSHYDFTTWFVDRQGDLRCDDIHHDGTNHYLYRVWRDDVTESQKDRLKARIYDGIATCSDITRVTRRLGDEIGKVYGWTFPTRQPAYER